MCTRQPDSPHRYSTSATAIVTKRWEGSTEHAEHTEHDEHRARPQRTEYESTGSAAQCAGTRSQALGPSFSVAVPALPARMTIHDQASPSFPGPLLPQCASLGTLLRGRPPSTHCCRWQVCPSRFLTLIILPQPLVPRLHDSHRCWSRRDVFASLFELQLLFPSLLHR